MSDLATIEARALAFSEARKELKAEIDDLQHVIETAKRQRMKRLRELVAEAKAKKAELKAEIEAAPEVFKRPKTRVLHQIKVGFAKGRQSLPIADPDGVVKQVRKLFKDRFNALVKVTEAPNKTALIRLPAKDLTRLGLKVREGKNETVVAPEDSEVDKIVTALLDDAKDKAETGA